MNTNIPRVPDPWSLVLLLQAVEVASALALGLPALVREGLSVTGQRHQPRTELTEAAEASV